LRGSRPAQRQASQYLADGSPPTQGFIVSDSEFVTHGLKNFCGNMSRFVTQNSQSRNPLNEAIPSQSLMPITLYIVANRLIHVIKNAENQERAKY
jgi:hypothetical protein